MGNTHAPYSQEEKDRILARLLPPSSENINAISAETGISLPTLRKWLTDTKTEVSPEDDAAAKMDAEQIFQVIIDTATMDELQLGEYARSKGLYVQTIKNWAQNARLSNGAGAYSPAKCREIEENSKSSAKEIAALKAKIAEMEKKETEKNKVIAEQAAIIILQKKTFQLMS